MFSQPDLASDIAGEIGDVSSVGISESPGDGRAASAKAESMLAGDSSLVSLIGEVERDSCPGSDSFDTS